MRNPLHLVLASIVVLFAATGAHAQPADGDLRVYIGTYTRGESKGIYLARLELKTGKLTLEGLAGEATNPSFLAIHPNRRFLYSVGEIGEFQGKRVGAVNAFQIDADTGRLSLLNQQSSGGSGPCHVTVDRRGKNALVANYGGGSVAVLPIQGDGRLGEATAFIQHEGSSVNPNRQRGPHAHSVNLDPANRFAFVADLGLDKVLVYRFDGDHGTLAPHPPAVVAPGSGPRHFAFHPNGEFAYVINELTSTVTAFAYNKSSGVLSEVQTVSTLPSDFQGQNSTAEVQVHPSGQFLFGSNRGHNSIAVFAIDTTSGKLTPVEHESTQGKTPRNFGVDPTGQYLLAANQDSNTVVMFRIDPKCGALEPAGQQIEVGSPVCVKFLPPGR